MFQQEVRGQKKSIFFFNFLIFLGQLDGLYISHPPTPSTLRIFCVETPPLPIEKSIFFRFNR